MNVSPELETPEQQGSRLRGVLGALLGAFLGAFVCDLFLYLFSDTVGVLTLFWGLLLVGWTACWGYRLLGGFRSMRFARWAVRGGALVGNLLAVVPAHTLADLWRWYGTLWVHTDILYDTVSHAVGHMRNGLVLWVILALGSVACCQQGLVSILFKYIDPVWYSDPRRLAQIGGGGATFNLPAHWPLPTNEHIPAAFEVANGKLTVDGDTIIIKRIGKPLQKFSVNDVAGVVLGVPSGYNILYNRNNKALTRFAWSWKGAELFGQYLLGRQVPFMDPQGDTTPQVEEQPRRFEVQEGTSYLWLGIVGLVFFGGLSVLCLFVLAELDVLTILMALTVCPFWVLVSVWMLLSYKNRRLAVEGDTLTYTTAFRQTTRFRISDVDRIKWGGVVSSRLKDRTGKTLARFDMTMKNYELLIAYLNAHLIE